MGILETLALIFIAPFVFVMVVSVVLVLIVLILSGLLSLIYAFAMVIGLSK